MASLNTFADLLAHAESSGRARRTTSSRAAPTSDEIASWYLEATA